MLHLKPQVWPWPGVTHKDRLEPSPACGGILVGGSVCAHLLREEGREVCTDSPGCLRFTVFSVYLS